MSRTIYTSPKGVARNEFSHAQANVYRESPAKFFWQRIKGYWPRRDFATSMLGKDVQEAIRRFYVDHTDPVETAGALWDSRKDQDLDYGQRETWKTLNEDAVGIAAAFKNEAREFESPIFPEYRDRLRAHLAGDCYVSIPDIVTSDAKGPLTVDIKVLAHPVAETPQAAIMDSQLRTQAAVTGILRVALWVFPRTAKTIAPTVLDIRNICAGQPSFLIVEAVRKSLDMTIAEAGEFLGVNDPKVKIQEFKKLSKADGGLVQTAERMAADISARCRSEYPVQWLDGTMTAEWAAEALSADMGLLPHIRAGEFPCRCGIRWPNDTMPRCAYRGLCLERAAQDLSPAAKEWCAEVTKQELKTWDEGAMEDLG